MSSNLCLLSSDFGSQGFLGESNLTDGSVESEDGALDFSLGGLESWKGEGFVIKEEYLRGRRAWRRS